MPHDDIFLYPVCLIDSTVLSHCYFTNIFVMWPFVLIDKIFNQHKNYDVD